MASIYHKLRAPQSYVEADREERARVCNGCGPSGWLGKIVPNTIYGLDVREVCNIHDWEYQNGKDGRAKTRADENFLHNLNTIIREKTPWWLYPLRVLRYGRAFVYYSFVVVEGADAFWENKEVKI